MRSARGTTALPGRRPNHATISPAAWSATFAQASAKSPLEYWRVTEVEYRSAAAKPEEESRERTPVPETTSQLLGGQRLPSEDALQKLGGQRLPSESSSRSLAGQRLPSEALDQNHGGQRLPSVIAKRESRDRWRQFRGREGNPRTLRQATAARVSHSRLSIAVQSASRSSTRPSQPGTSCSMPVLAPRAWTYRPWASSWRISRLRSCGSRSQYQATPKAA